MVPWHYGSLVADLNGGKEKMQNLPLRMFGEGIEPLEEEYWCLIPHIWSHLLGITVGYLRTPASCVIQNLRISYLSLSFLM